MQHIKTVALKELRSYFHSAVGVIFLATFLIALLISFFWVERFFARGIADIRPLFESMPLILILLTSALTMRLWSEEHLTGTAEVLMTLPIPTHRFVLGKFVAGLLLISIALVLTLGIPITVSLMGNLDWGPVIGGYLGTLLLAGAYLSIGLFVSALTNNQIVALIGSAIVCVVFYLVGHPSFTGAFSFDTAEVLRGIGTGSRFQNVARGVLDLRDLAYFVGITVSFVVLNVAVLRSRRWSKNEKRVGDRFNVLAGVALVFANVTLANVWLAPIRSVSADVTQENLYSLTPTTERILSSLKERLLIRGYLSEENDESIQPALPYIREMLKLYQDAGARVRVEFEDPMRIKDEDEQKKRRQEIGDKYGIFSDIKRNEGRNSMTLVNAYTHVLVEYGDKHEVLDLRTIAKTKRRGKAVVAEFPTLEYRVTAAIQKAVRSFHEPENPLRAVPGQIKLDMIATAKADLPAHAIAEDTFDDPRKKLAKAIEELAKEVPGKIAFTEKNPKTFSEFVALGKRGIQVSPDKVVPAPSGKQEDTFVVYYPPRLEVQVEGEPPRSVVVNSDKADEIKKQLKELLRQYAPSLSRKVGLVVPPPKFGPPRPGSQRPTQTPPAQNFGFITEILRQDYEVTPVFFSEPRVPASVQVLLIAGAEELDDNARYAIDQFLMGGGTVIVFVGNRILQGSRQVPLSHSLSPVKSGLEAQLESYGVKIGQKVVLDERSYKTRVLEFVRGRGAELGRSVDNAGLLRIEEPKAGLITAGIDQLGVFFAHPLSETAAKTMKGVDGQESVAELTYQHIFKTSDKSWLVAAPNRVLPQESVTMPSTVADDEKGPFTVGLVVEGRFHSHYQDGAPDAIRAALAGGAGEDAPGKAKAELGDPTVTISPAGTRLVVVGSSSVISDEGLRLFGGELIPDEDKEDWNYESSLTLVQNLVSWALADDELAGMRVRGDFKRRLKVENETKWEVINYALAAFGLFIVVGYGIYRRRSMVPFELVGVTSGVRKSASEGRKQSKPATASDVAADEQEGNDDDQDQ